MSGSARSLPAHAHDGGALSPADGRARRPSRSRSAAECRLRLRAAVNRVAQRTNPATRALVLSGGVDTCAILDAAASSGTTFAVAVTVIVEGRSGDDPPPDGAFAARAAAEARGLDHRVVRVAVDDLVERHLPRTVKLLRTFDGMTLRNSLVVSAAFEELRALGATDAIVGDGADELFGGYSFMWGSADDPAAWKKKRDDMCREWTFATSKLAESYGIVSHGPFLDDEFVEWALNHTTRVDCIGERPIKLTLDGEAIPHLVGKILLREAFDTCASWRRKDPIEVGSGATVIGTDEYWADRLSDEEYARETKDFRERGVVVRTKEHLINLRAYIDTFGGLVHPEKKRMPMGEGCVGCCFELEEGKNFCFVCGAWPAQRSGIVS